MILNDVFQKRRKNLTHLMELRKYGQPEMKIECPHCHEKIEKSVLKENLKVCPECSYYFPLVPEERLRMLADEKSFHELDKKLMTKNPLDFPGYDEKLKENQEKTGKNDAIMTGTIRIGGIRTAIGVLDGRFLMGSMGTVVGEKITRLAEYAASKKLPLVIFSASGGVRMQEGLFSLLQMAKTSAAIERYKSQGGLFISCLTNPTTGGVSASYANLGDRSSQNLEH